MSAAAAPAAPVCERWECPLCGVDDAAHVTTEGGLDVACCVRCGLAYLRPRPTAEELSAFYDGTYYASTAAGTIGYADYGRHEAGLRLVGRERLDLMHRYLAPGRVLDVGCAYGYFLDIARAGGWEALGVELAHEAAQAAQTAFDLDVRAGTLHDAAFSDAAFDAVTLWDSLEHTLEPVEILAEVRRILRPGGCCFMTVPDAGTWIARLLGRHWFGYRKAGEHTFFFTRHTLRIALARVGLVPLHMGPGVWPCDLMFLAEKFAQYSGLVSRAGVAVLRATGLGDRIVRFPLIDMQVVAMRPAD